MFFNLISPRQPNDNDEYEANNKLSIHKTIALFVFERLLIKWRARIFLGIVCVCIRLECVVCDKYTYSQTVNSLSSQMKYMMG